MSEKPLLTPGVDLADLLRPLVTVKAIQQSCRDGRGPGRDFNWVECEPDWETLTIRVAVNNDVLPMGAKWNAWCDGFGDIPVRAKLGQSYFDEPENVYVANYGITCEPI